MTDLEISKALALAIGWKSDDFCGWVSDQLEIDIGDDKTGDPQWYIFDYRDWNVIGPIAEEYDCFPSQNYQGQWRTELRHRGEDTPQKAIALAVIGAKK